MGKVITPVMGQTAEELFNNLRELDMTKKRPFDYEHFSFGEPSEDAKHARAMIKAVLDKVRSHVNIEICVSPNQAKQIALDIREGRDRLEEALNHRASGVSLGAIEERLTHHLVTVINSYHLECEHCLNRVCEQRDPDKQCDQPPENDESPAVRFSGISGFAVRQLERANIHTLNAIAKLTESEFDRIIGVSKPSYKDHAAGVLRRHNLKLSETSSVDFVRALYVKGLFSTKLGKVLQNASIFTLGDVCDRSERELLRIKGFGKVSLADVKKTLPFFGLKLKEDD